MHILHEAIYKYILVTINEEWKKLIIAQPRSERLQDLDANLVRGQ